jgi:hypothetical protein
MSIKVLQNFYKQTVSVAWATGTGNRYVSVKPTVSAGWLVVSPANSTLREIVEFSGTGTDGNGDYITLVTRGVGGTTEQSHVVNEPIRMNYTAQHQAEISGLLDDRIALTALDTDPTLSANSDTKVPSQKAIKKYADDLAIAGSPVATTTTPGISYLSAAPSGSSISVSVTDTRLPSQDENDALAGTSGTPSTSNKFVTNDDTSATSSANKLVRANASGNIGGWLNFGGTGADGALTASSGTTTGIDGALAPSYNKCS